MKAANLKSKLNKMNVSFIEKVEQASIYFSINNKNYEASVTISGEVCSYCTGNYSKFEGRTFDNLKQVIKHATR